jgi:hypothetical protein
MTTSTNGLGVNVDRVTAGTTTNGQDREFALGTQVLGADGTLYRYVQAGAAISTTVNQPLGLCIDENEQAVLSTGPHLLAGHRVGFAPKQIIADNAFFWARMQGVFPIKVAVSTAADVPLRITVAGTGGVLTSASLTASGVTVLGVVLTLAASTSASAGSTIRTALAGPLVVNIRQTAI